MGIVRKRDGTTIYTCDVCGAERVDKAEGNWDEGRLVSARAREDGCRIKKRPGRVIKRRTGSGTVRYFHQPAVVEVFCPECAQHIPGYYSLWPP